MLRRILFLLIAVFILADTAHSFDIRRWMQVYSGGASIPRVEFLALCADSSGVMQLQCVGEGTPSVTRTTAALCLDNQGIWQTVSANLPCWHGARWSAGDAYNDDGSGSLLAPQPLFIAYPPITNDILHSNNIADAAWTKQAGASANLNAVGITGDANTASTVVVPTAIQGAYQALAAGTFTNDAVLGFKCWLKTVTTSGTLQIRTTSSTTLGDWSVDLSKVSTTVFEELTPDHEAVTVANAFVANGTGGAGVWFLSPGDVPLTIIVGDTILAETSQSVMTDMMPVRTTSAAVTTGAQTTAFSLDNHSNTSGAYYAEWEPSYDQTEAIAAANQGIISSNGGGTVNSILYINGSASGRVYSDDGTATVINDPTYIKNTVYKLGIPYSSAASDRAIYVDGVEDVDADGYDGSFATGTGIEVLEGVLQTAKLRNLTRYQAAPYISLKSVITDRSKAYIKVDGYYMSLDGDRMYLQKEYH